MFLHRYLFVEFLTNWSIDRLNNKPLPYWLPSLMDFGRWPDPNDLQVSECIIVFNSFFQISALLIYHDGSSVPCISKNLNSHLFHISFPPQSVLTLASIGWISLVLDPAWLFHLLFILYDINHASCNFLFLFYCISVYE